MSGVEVAVTELAILRADYFASLPGDASFYARAVGWDGGWSVSKTPARLEALRAQGAVVFDADEWTAMVAAAENDRASAPTLLGWLSHKQAVRHWRLKSVDALGGHVGPLVARGWSVGRVLRAYGATLVRVVAS